MRPFEQWFCEETRRLENTPDEFSNKNKTIEQKDTNKQLELDEDAAYLDNIYSDYDGYLASVADDDGFWGY